MVTFEARFVFWLFSLFWFVLEYYFVAGWGFVVVGVLF